MPTKRVCGCGLRPTPRRVETYGVRSSPARKWIADRATGAVDAAVKAAGAYGGYKAAEYAWKKVERMLE